jgi:DNA-directed RNA polymerase I and III subunit RPAC1
LLRFRLSPCTDPREQATDRNTLVFKLQATCTRKPDAPKGDAVPAAELYENHEVTAGHLVWAPAGDQEEQFAAAGVRPGPTNPNIVLAKLRPGQAIDMELHAVKGVGKDHAKFTPVGAPPVLVLPSPRETHAEAVSDGVVPPASAHHLEPG